MCPKGVNLAVCPKGVSLAACPRGERWEEAEPASRCRGGSAADLVYQHCWATALGQGKAWRRAEHCVAGVSDLCCASKAQVRSPQHCTGLLQQVWLLWQWGCRSEVGLEHSRAVGVEWAQLPGCCV